MGVNFPSDLDKLNVFLKLKAKTIIYQISVVSELSTLLPSIS